jgi:hypothetical protein
MRALHFDAVTCCTAKQQIRRRVCEPIITRMVRGLSGLPFRSVMIHFTIGGGFNSTLTICAKPFEQLAQVSLQFCPEPRLE